MANNDKDEQEQTVIPTLNLSEGLAVDVKMTVTLSFDRGDVQAIFPDLGATLHLYDGVQDLGYWRAVSAPRRVTFGPMQAVEYELGRLPQPRPRAKGQTIRDVLRGQEGVK